MFKKSPSLPVQFKLLSFFRNTIVPVQSGYCFNGPLPSQPFSDRSLVRRVWSQSGVGQRKRRGADLLQENQGQSAGEWAEFGGKESTQ